MKWCHRVVWGPDGRRSGTVHRIHWNRHSGGGECSKEGRRRSPWPSVVPGGICGEVQRPQRPRRFSSSEGGVRPRGSDWWTSTGPLGDARDCSTAPHSFFCPTPPLVHPYCTHTQQQQQQLSLMWIHTINWNEPTLQWELYDISDSTIHLNHFACQ